MSGSLNQTNSPIGLRKENKISEKRRQSHGKEATSPKANSKPDCKNFLRSLKTENDDDNESQVRQADTDTLNHRHPQGSR